MALSKRKQLNSSIEIWPEWNSPLTIISIYLLILCIFSVLLIICFACLDVAVAHAETIGGSLDIDNTGSASSGGAFSTGEGFGGDWGQLDSFLAKFKSLAAGSDGTVLSFATSLFGKLILLDFAIAALLNVVNFGEFNQSFAMLIGKFFKYGFWMWVIANWTSGLDFCGLILKSFTEVGSAAGASGYGSAVAGAETLEHPSYIIGRGFAYAAAYFSYILAPKGILELGIMVAAPFTIVWKFLLACFGAVGILVAFLMIGLNVVTTMIEFYMVSTLGLILIPFGAFDKTEQFGTQNFKYVMGIGIKLMFMAAIIGMMSTTVWAMGTSWSMGDVVNFVSRPGVGQTVQAVLMAWIFAYISCEVPSMAGAALSGAPALTGHNLMGHAIGAAMAVTAVASGGATLLGGAVGVTSAMGGSAVSTAAKAASAAFNGAGGGMQGAMAGVRAFTGSYGSSTLSQMGTAWRNATTGLATSFNEGAVKAQDRADKQNYGHYNPPFGYNDNPYMKNGQSVHPEAAPINSMGGQYAKDVLAGLKKGTNEAGSQAPRSVYK